jgi:hypothetical protein
MKPSIPFLETMITQVCNLTCDGCTNHSDLQHSGYVKWSDGKSQLERWLEVLNIPQFGIMGGEPLVNPQVNSWLAGVRELMPHSRIYLFTNGLLLHKYPNIIETMQDLGDAVLRITVHLEDARLKATISNILSRYRWEAYAENSTYANGGAEGHVFRWRTANGVELHIKHPTTFVKSFRGPYKNMMPFESNAREAFALCVQQTCPLLYQGRIYKCSTSALLRDTLARFGNPNLDAWSQYLDNGITPTDGPDRIQRFISNYGHPSTICGQCPSHKDQDAVVIHTSQLKSTCTV